MCIGMGNIADLCISTTKELRSLYYRYGKTQTKCDTVPFGGSIKESIGPFPEFILKGRFCKRSLKGYCTPCFYSKLPQHTISDLEFNKGYLSQVDFIINNFDSLVLNNQVGRVAFHYDTDKKICGMVCTPTGSYFDNKEYPITIRKKNLKKIIKLSEKRDCLIALHIETHAEDVLEYFSNPDKEEISLLKKLNTRVILGFESINELSRNVHYAKKLQLQDFEKAVSLLKSNGFAVGAFVFAGLFAMTEQETIRDTYESFVYLKSIGVAPVLMFANTQKYTIPDVLLDIKKYKLLDPRTVQKIVENMLDIFGNDMTGQIDPWLIADPKGGPPEPNLHIFNSPDSTACSKCSEKIYNAIENLRVTKSINQFRQECRSLKDCDCNINYDKFIKQQMRDESIGRIQRIQEAITLVKEHEDVYNREENPWIVKAELLCYGLKLSEEQFQLAESINPYIRERGFIHAVHITYKGYNVNICVAEKFCQKSPYAVTIVDSKWHLNYKGKDVGEFEFLPMPEWTRQNIRGHEIGKLVRPHTNQCVSLWPSTICSYIEKNKGCKFCCLNKPDEKASVSDQQFVADALKIALEYNHKYEINLSGGTCGDPDSAIDYLSSICEKIKEITSKYNTPISVEFVPPSTEKKLIQLKENGVTSVIMDLDIYDEKSRTEICPGKGKIALSHYKEMLEKSVSIFGKGNVSSVLIVGIQPEDDIKKACKELILLGVIPTLIPFKPLDNAFMEENPVTDAKQYIELSSFLSEKMKGINLGIKCNSGCASCGGCSLEVDLIGRC